MKVGCWWPRHQLAQYIRCNSQTTTFKFSVIGNPWYLPWNVPLTVAARTKLKKLFVPLLIILKLFKLKLLLFLPLILGLASFKKVLGFLALVIPGLIGFFKLCKPDLHHNYGSYGHSSFYHQPPHHHKHQYSTSGVATGHHYFRWEYRRLKHDGLQICHRIWDSHGGGFELHRLLWCDDVQSGKNLKRVSEKNTDTRSSER